MNNEWLDIELSDYENHMSMPGIEQAQYLSTYFSEVVDKYDPESLAILGCAGGNGLDKLDPNKIKRIVCCDINPNFIVEAENRYKDKFKNIEFICGDIADKEYNINKVTLIYAALILEYVDIEKAIKNIYKFLEPKGILAAVLQLPNKDIPEVSPSPYKNLEKLSDIFSFVSIDKLVKTCSDNRITLVSYNEIQLKSEKKFAELILEKV